MVHLAALFLLMCKSKGRPGSRLRRPLLVFVQPNSSLPKLYFNETYNWVTGYAIAITLRRAGAPHKATHYW